MAGNWNHMVGAGEESSPVGGVIGPVVEGEVILPGCDTFWGSHGCSLDDVHNRDEQPVHSCGLEDDPEGPCSQARLRPDGVTETRAALYSDIETPVWEWSDWRPGVDLFRMDGKPAR